MKSVAAKVDALSDHMGDMDRTLLPENLKLTFEQRSEKHLHALQMVEELRRAGKKLAEHRLKACVPSKHVVCSTLGAE
jgi:hypothetical protein